jgi:hypothetical protein
VGPGLFHLRYLIEGDFWRVPVFIPNTARDQVEPIKLIVVGATEGMLRGSDLDFELQSDGTHMSIVAVLPAVLTLAPPRRPLSLEPALLWAALLLAAAGLGIFAIVRAARAGHAPGG